MAQRAEPREGRGTSVPLHGIPLAIKDNYYTTGRTARRRTPSCSRISFRPTTRHRWPGWTGNGRDRAGQDPDGPAGDDPGDDSRRCGHHGQRLGADRSAGSTPAAPPPAPRTAVAGRDGDRRGTGTQTGGSITAPSNAQNLTGLKPTMGRVSLHGIIPLTYTRDHPGPLARDAKDAAIMLHRVAGEDPQDPRTQGLPPVPEPIYRRQARYAAERQEWALRWQTRIGVLPGFAEGELGTSDGAHRRYLTKLASIPGACLVDVPFPDEWDPAHRQRVQQRPSCPNAVSRSWPYLREDLPRLRGVGAGLAAGRAAGWERVPHRPASQVSFCWNAILDQIFDHCDVVVQPTPVPFDILGLPEIAFPIGFTGEWVADRDHPRRAALRRGPAAESARPPTRRSPTGTGDARRIHRCRPPTPSAARR